MKSIFEDIFGGGMFKGVYDLLNVLLIGDGAKYSSAAKLVENVYTNLMVPVALAFLVIFFVCTLVEKTTMEQSNLEQMFLLFAKLVVGVFLIDKGFDLMIYFQQLGVAFLGDFNDFTTAQMRGGGGFDIEKSKTLQKLYEEYVGVAWPDSPGWFDTFKNIFTGGTLSLLMAWMFSFILKAAIYLIMFMRILEIYIRTMFAPLALSDVLYQGLNSTGFRFLKGYLAVSLQMVVIYGCIALNTVIAADIAKSADAANSIFLFKYMGLTAATIGILFKSQSLIKEFIGAT
ncbi:MAG: hypothetical protein ACI4KJ_01675 [Anaerovoracaceae bacterium]